MVKAVVPGAAELLAVSVSTLVPDVGFVPHDAVTPLGNADVIASVTFPGESACVSNCDGG